VDLPFRAPYRCLNSWHIEQLPLGLIACIASAEKNLVRGGNPELREFACRPGPLPGLNPGIKPG
jgi:hypothetical protein